MDNRLTELEKSILLAFLVLSKGAQKYLDRDLIVLKFPRQQRRSVRKYLIKLLDKKLITKHPREERYQLSEAGLKRSGKVLSEGAVLWRL